RIDEQRPAILQVRDHRHADDAHHELHPAEVRRLALNGRRLVWRNAHFFSPRHAIVYFSSADRSGMGRCPRRILVCIMPERKSFFCRTCGTRAMSQETAGSCFLGYDASLSIRLDKPDKGGTTESKKDPGVNRGR